jgi:hypothetical protein
MALVTGTPEGTLTTQEDLYLEGAPNIYFQDYSAAPMYNPDGDGFYWGLSGTAAYPVYEVGCPTDVSLTEDLTINNVLCDNVGVKDTVQQRNYVQFEFTIQSFFPYDVLRHMLQGGAVTETAPTQKFGMGTISQTQRWMVYCPKVYDVDAADYIWIHLNKAKFVEAWTVAMTFGSPWQMTGIRLRAYADTTKPQAQYFGMWGRLDPSVIT